MKKSLLSLAVASSLGLVSAGALADPIDFQVNEAAYGGAGLVTADLINGGYVEVITFDGLGGFATKALASFSQFYLNDNPTPVSGSSLGPAGTYNMYAVLDETGTVSGNTFTGGAGSMHLYLDPGQNTTLGLGATGNDPVAIGNNGDDIEIAWSTNIVSGFGVLIPNIGGFFDIWFDDLQLTAAGSSYFVNPNPFYVKANVDGDFNTFQIQGTQRIGGDVSVVFAVPEPGTLALLGLAMAGMGLGLRRKNLA